MPITVRFKAGDPVDINNFTSKEDGVLTVDLGDDESTGLSYSLWCTLQPTISAGKMEFSFWIADYDPHTHHMCRIWHGNETKHLLQGEDRQFVLLLIQEALRWLVAHFQPKQVFMQTMAPNMPHKALVKYYELGHVLEAMGYEFRRLSPFHDYEAWLAKRREQ